MIVDEFRSLLAQSDLEFVDVIETEAFQRMLEKDFSFHSELDQSSQWRLLYGLWVVLLDFADDPDSAWQPSEVTIPGLSNSLSLQDVLQVLVVTDFDSNRIDWSDEPGFEDEVDQHLYSSALQSEACRQLVEHQIEAGLMRVLTCDFSPAPAQVVQRQLGPLRKALAACMSLFEDRMPRL